MASVSRLLRFGILLLFICIVCFSDVADAKKRKKKKKPPLPEVTITQYDLCQGCLTTTELLHTAIKEEVEKPSNSRLQPDGETLPIDGAEIAAQLCSGPKFTDIKDELRFACVHLMQTNLSSLLSPFVGNYQLSHAKAKSQVLRAKREVCGTTHESAVHACTANHLAETFTEKTPCAACQALVKDVEFLIYREKKITKKRLGIILEPLCEGISMRHESPAYMEDICDEIMDEIDASIISVVNMRLHLEKSGLGLTNSLADKVCGEMAKICPVEGEGSMNEL